MSEISVDSLLPSLTRSLASHSTQIFKYTMRGAPTSLLSTWSGAASRWVACFARRLWIISLCPYITWHSAHGYCFPFFLAKASASRCAPSAVMSTSPTSAGDVKTQSASELPSCTEALDDALPFPVPFMVRPLVGDPRHIGLATRQAQV